MKSVLTFVGKHWLTLGLLIASVVAVRWVVATQRAPGSMSIVEAQAMDMTAMKPPPGVFPVAVEEAMHRAIGSKSSFPAEVLAYSDEDVVARIMGRVRKVLVYPGDRVKAGQLLATLDADETAAMAGESRLMAATKRNMALAARQMVKERQAMLARARAGLASSKAAVARVEEEFEAAKEDAMRIGKGMTTADAEAGEMNAQLEYASSEYSRAQKLYDEGAISLNELQAAKRDRDTASDRLRAAHSRLQAAKHDAFAASRRVNAVMKQRGEASAMVKMAQSELDSAQAAAKRAQSEAAGASREAESASAGASGLSAMADYRNLRALDGGEVSERVVSPGTAVMPGMTVLKLKVVDKVRVQAEIPQAMAHSVQVGSSVRVIGDGVERQALVTSVFPTVSAESRTFRIEAVVDNGDRALMPGMFVRVSLGSADAEETLAVRSSAIRTDADGMSYVWLMAAKPSKEAKADWTCTMHPEVSEPGPGICPSCKMDLVPREGAAGHVAERRNVRVGPSDGTWTVIHTGLEHGAKVIWAGHEDLFPGAAVEETAWGANGPRTLPNAPGVKPDSGMDHGSAEGHS